MSAWSQAPSVSTVMGFAEPTDSEVFKSEEYRVALNFAQNVDMFAIVLYIGTKYTDTYWYRNAGLNLNFLSRCFN